ncbi:MAG: hypothetical protein COU71_02875 [Parcubacteria group bacterium CG10_big_fil_rev_8_21_14_0_10_38_31]|nr:MAG: hypothetical protein COU71_02875 [Parcubacteria group bacterium CG10_big_fil_rev_8_21_14_0_10_38_31]
MNKKIIFSIIALFILSFGLRITPIVYKGYAPTGLHGDLIIARNLAQTGEYKLESEKNIILASSRVKDEGSISTLGNRLTILLEAEVFKFFGFSANLPFYFSVFLFALSTVLICLLVLRLFGNFYLAFSSALFDTFMPFVWKGALFAGSYEFASVFFLLGLLIYFWRGSKELLFLSSGHEEDADHKMALFRHNYIQLILSGIFLGLAIVSRNAFVLSVIPIIIYELYISRSWKRVFIFALPVILIFGSFGVFNNSYITGTDESFSRYGHLFPDPYTYHFEKDAYIESIADLSDPDLLEFQLKYGYDVSIINKLKMYLNSAIFYPKQTFSIINFGGPFFLFLIFLGGTYLYKERKELFKFFLLWVTLWYIGLIALKTNNWDHFLEIRFAIISLISLGVLVLIKMFSRSIESRRKYILFGVSLVVLLSLQLFTSNKWMFHESYETSFLPEALPIIEELRKEEIGDNEVMAVSFNQSAPLLFNYYLDKSFVYFAPETIEKLKTEDKLEEIFSQFGVTRFIE